MKNKTILFDIDHTIFDTNKYLDYMFATLAKHVPEKTPEDVKEQAEKVYIHMRETDVFHPKRFAVRFAEEVGLDTKTRETIEKALENNVFLASCLYADVRQTLQVLSHLPQVTLGIFSSGDRELQLAKIQPLAQFFTPENMHIYSLKDTQVRTILKQYDMSEIFIIDDVTRVLFEVKTQDSSVVTILMKREGKEDDEVNADGFRADFTITSLPELLHLIN